MGAKVVFCFFGVFISLVGLWWTSEKSVEYALGLSKVFGITPFFIGFLLMAIATGLPELAISLASLWEGVPLVAAGDIIGSNLGDISLVLGLPAVLLGTLNVKKEEKLPLMAMLLVTAVVMAIVFIIGVLNRFYGFALIILYFASVYWLWKTKVTKVVPEEEAVEELSGDGVKKRRSWSVKTRLALKMFVSLGGVVLFSKISVDCAVSIARYYLFNLHSIGATIFAIGTSMPELALSFQAVRKHEYALAFGNSFGSVLEQATLILGVLAIGAGKSLDIRSLRVVAPLMFLSYAVVAHSLLKKPKVGRQEGLGRREGIILLVLFSIHLIYFIFWGL